MATRPLYHYRLGLEFKTYTHLEFTCHIDNFTLCLVHIQYIISILVFYELFLRVKINPYITNVIHDVVPSHANYIVYALLWNNKVTIYCRVIVKTFGLHH